jgi:hypothetical protein
MNRVHMKSDWVDGKYITMLKYKDEYIDVGILNQMTIKRIAEWCYDAVSEAYKAGLTEGAEIAKEVYKGK